MSDDFNRSMAAFGLSPQVAQYIDLVRTVVSLGSGVYNIVATSTGDQGVLLAARWMDFFLGVNLVPPGLSEEDLEKLADVCANTGWMEDTGSALAAQVAGTLTPLLSAIPGAGGVAKTVTEIVLAIWGFARLFRNKICSSPEVRAVINRRPDLAARVADAVPASLRADHAAALRRRLAVEAALEEGQRNPPSTPEGRELLARAQDDDVPSSERLIATERLMLRFGGIPSLQGAPPTAVARRYVRRPPGFAPPTRIVFRPLPGIRYTFPKPNSSSSSGAGAAVGVAAVVGLFYFILSRRT